MKEKRLKPCPFCKHRAEIVKDSLYQNGHGYYGCYDFYIECSNEKCGVQPKTRAYDNIYEKDEKKIIQKITKIWNHREDEEE